MSLQSAKSRVAALTAPRNAVIVGASDRPGHWSARVWRNLNRYAFPGPIYLVNPQRQEIWGHPCHPDVNALPEPPDHLVMLIPARAVPDALRRGAEAGARSATIFSTGFGEAGDPDGLENRKRLEAVIAETGIAVSGPNCFGNATARSRLVTLVEDRLLTLQPGPVALVGQSGGIMIFINHALEERGIAAGYIITSGNEVGLGLPDYLAFLAGEPELKVIITYVDAVTRLNDLIAACRMVQQAGKTIIAIKLGQSPAGREAAMAHTGLLAGEMVAFDAVTGDLGVIRAETIDDAVEMAELLVHTGPVPGRRLGGVTLSGAYRGLLLDAAMSNGLSFPLLAEETMAKLRAVLSVGSYVGNPIDGGFGVISSAETYMTCIEALDADPNVDAILLQEALPREPGAQRAEKYIGLVENFRTTRGTKPISFVTVASHGQTDFSRKLRAGAPHVSFLQEAHRALGAIRGSARRAELLAIAHEPFGREPVPAGAAAMMRELSDNSAAGPTALHEVDSKRLLRAYGIAAPDERLVTGKDAAVAAAMDMGYPVVLKAVSPKLLHKSDIGAVALGLADADQVGAAYDQILTNVAQVGLASELSGMLVCQQISGGLELALGLHRDREMGLVAMVATGGVLLELIEDAAFAAPPITPAKAQDMIERTRIAKLLDGYRGRPKYDAKPLIEALAALGRVAQDLPDFIESVDINPFVLLPTGQAGLALDALIVLAPRA